jgi:alkylation response protein AidB-like acyl-CoA dehydrogenase
MFTLTPNNIAVRDMAKSFAEEVSHPMPLEWEDASRLCGMAKRVVTDAGSSAANDALQSLGGYGYLADYGVENLVRDLRVHQILEGTNEIMRVIVARSLIEN